LIEDLRAGHVAYIDGGRGACNTTYVDNLIDAMFLGLENDAALNQVFLITDGERITWGDFIRAHVALLASPPEIKDITRAEIEASRGKKSGMVMGSVKAMARVARSKPFREMLLQIPLTEAAMKKAWNWVGSMPPEKREKMRARFGVKRAPAKSANAKFIPDEVTEATQSTTVFFSIEKARKMLGYQPRVQFADGMKRVEQWLRYAAYL
jgi:nucleoside-diphosphate-sugar epimerase